MNERKIYLLRHGETAWSLSGQHTGTTDIPLTENGYRQAQALANRLASHKFQKVFSSPSKRATETCKICGLFNHAEILDDLNEWNYGNYEGMTTLEILKKDPEWNIFKKGAPEGESISDISSRADRILKKIEEFDGEVAIFSSAHFLRALITRWLNLPVMEAKSFLISPASLSILGYEKENPVLVTLNDVSHLKE